MTERGIPFKPNMIQAIREGRKTQTRRLIKLPNVVARRGEWEPIEMGGKGVYLDKAHTKPAPMNLFGMFHNYTGQGVIARYQVGDRVYVKEGWATESRYDTLPPRLIPAGATIWYAMDGVGEWPIGLEIGKLRSPMFMPNRFARKWGTVTEVRAQRLQAITEADAVAEGCRAGIVWPDKYPNDKGTARDDYAALWDSINPKPYRWADNPFVFAYTLKLD